MNYVVKPDTTSGSTTPQVKGPIPSPLPVRLDRQDAFALVRVSAKE
jgi:hypothetical protein